MVCRIEQCRFESIGGYGLWLYLDSCENAIDANTITAGHPARVVISTAHANGWIAIEGVGFVRVTE